MKKVLLISMALIMFAACTTNEQTQKRENKRDYYINFAHQMAKSQMVHNPELWQSDFVKKPKWDYTQGIIANAMLEVYLQTEDSSLLTYVQDFADYFIHTDGSIEVYDQSKYNIDHVAGGNFLFTLNRINPHKEYPLAINTLRSQLSTQPRTSEGGFWHKKVYPWQMWLDGLYMGEPFYARYATEYHQPELFDDIALQFLTVDKHTCDAATGLNYHGWDESKEQQWADSITGCSPHFWSRSIGWYEMALADVLEVMPTNHPQRQELINIFKRVSKSLMNYRDPESAMWYQLTIHGGKEGNYLESTASAMFCYAFAKGARLGLLDERYLDYAKETFDGMLRTVIITNEDSTISLTNCCAVAGLGGKPYRDGSYEYYVGEPIRNDDPKGVGPMMMAALELAKSEADIVVAKDGTGDFTSIQEAINAVPDYRKTRTIIRIKAGVYEEKVIIAPSKQLLSIIGQDAQTTILTYGNYADKPSGLGKDETLGTSGSATLYTAADDLYVENLTIENSAGEVGQAVAAHVSGDKVVFRKCRFLGNQDTLFTYQENSRQLYDRCYIEGTTDFIFGWSKAVFTSCQIHSKKDSYITAASTVQGQDYGYLFLDCDLTANDTIHSVYLGRPWRPYAQTVFMNCRMGAHIRPEGWHNWKKESNEKTAFYAEYNNTGAGADTSNRVNWAHILSQPQAEAYTPQNILAGSDHWNPYQILTYYRRK